MQVAAEGGAAAAAAALGAGAASSPKRSFFCRRSPSSRGVDTAERAVDATAADGDGDTHKTAAERRRDWCLPPDPISSSPPVHSVAVAAGDSSCSPSSCPSSPASFPSFLPAASAAAAALEVAAEGVAAEGGDRDSRGLAELDEGKQQRKNRKGGRTPLTPTMLLIISFTALTGLLMGYDLCVVGVVLGEIQKHFHLCGSNFSCGAKSLFVAILAPGAALGSALGGLLSDTLGRRSGLALSDALLLLGSIILGLGEAYWLMLVGRLVVGLGVGTGFVVYATYTSEISPADRRGQLVACQEVAQCFGCLVAYAMAAIFGEHTWKYLLGVAGVVAGVQILGEYWILPESPRFAVLRGDEARARASLRRIGHHDAAEIGRIIEELKKDCAAAAAAKAPPARALRDTAAADAAAGTAAAAAGAAAAAAGAASGGAGTGDAGGAETAEEGSSSSSRRPQSGRSSGRKGSCCASRCCSHSAERCSSSDSGSRQRRRSSSSSEPDSTGATNAPHSSVGVRLSSSIGSSGSICRSSSSSRANHAAPPQHWRRADCGEQREKGSPAPSLGSKGEKFYTCAADKWKGRRRSGTQPCCPAAAGITNFFSSPGRLSRPNVKLQLLLQHKRELFIAVGCAVAQNFTAANSVIYFSIDIFRLAGVRSPLLAGVGVGIVKFLGVLACLVFVDRAGRRLLLLVGSSGTLICHLLILTGFVMQGKTGLDIHAAAAEGGGGAPGVEAIAATWLLLVSLLIYIFCWNCSWAALMFVVASEVLPTALRGLGMGLTIMTFWLLSFVMQYSLEPLFTSITIPGTFGFLAFLNLFSLLFVIFAVPEGKGQTLEEMHRRPAAAALTRPHTSPSPPPPRSAAAASSSCRSRRRRSSSSSGSSGRNSSWRAGGLPPDQPHLRGSSLLQQNSRPLRPSSAAAAEGKQLASRCSSSRKASPAAAAALSELLSEPLSVGGEGGGGAGAAATPPPTTTAAAGRRRRSSAAVRVTRLGAACPAAAVDMEQAQQTRQSPSSEEATADDASSSEGSSSSWKARRTAVTPRCSGRKAAAAPVLPPAAEECVRSSWRKKSEIGKSLHAHASAAAARRSSSFPAATSDCI